MLRSDFERLHRASDFCHTMAAMELTKIEVNCENNDKTIDKFMAWRAHARAYSSAARLLLRQKRRRIADGTSRSWRTSL
jgi:hypothetical protein